MDPNSLLNSGLEFDAGFESSTVLFEDDLASEGFIVHVATMPTAISAPIVIPSGSDALITLAPPVRISELSECVSPDRLPKLERYEYYDPDAVHCFADVIMKNTFFELGCTVPLLTYRPTNETFCDSQRALILMQLVGGQIEESSKEIAKKVKGLVSVEGWSFFLAAL